MIWYLGNSYPPYPKMIACQWSVALAESNKSLIMGASTKGAGHHIWTSGTPLVLERAKNMIFGKGAGLGEVARISYVLPLSEPRETG